MKEIIDKHFNAVSLIIAIGAIVISFYSTNSSTNARIDAFYQANKDSNEKMEKISRDFHNRLIEIEIERKLKQ